MGQSASIRPAGRLCKSSTAEGAGGDEGETKSKEYEILNLHDCLGRHGGLHFKHPTP